MDTKTYVLLATGVALVAAACWHVSGWVGSAQTGNVDLAVGWLGYGFLAAAIVAHKPQQGQS